MKEKLWDEADASHYDDPAPSQSQLEAIHTTVDVLVELAGDGPALEFAIGTGRIGLPLERGVCPSRDSRTRQPWRVGSARKIPTDACR